MTEEIKSEDEMKRRKKQVDELKWRRNLETKSFSPVSDFNISDKYLIVRTGEKLVSENRRRRRQREKNVVSTTRRN